jgi:uroporphyrinogen decarboxylase
MDARTRFAAAAGGLAVDRPPVWMMRQAGRTLPEYRALKDQHSFWELCKTPELAAEATLQPVRRFPVDAAILFSDILVVPAAMGMQIEFSPAPRFAATLASQADVERLLPPDAGNRLRYVADALAIVRKEIGQTHAVLGFAGAPYTLACYMVDGTGAKGFAKTRALLHSQPLLMHRLLERVADAVAEYLELQIASGITAFQLFDSWAGDLSPAAFREFAARYAGRVLSRVTGKGAFSIYYVNGIAPHLAAAGAAGSDILGVDWRVDLARVRAEVGPLRVLQGNLDPAALHGSPESIAEATRTVLAATQGRNHILNLGHGLSPDTPLAGIEAFVQAATEWRNPER